jgi:hypothetical protein
VPPDTSAAITEENADARLDALGASLAGLAVLALGALLLSGRIPTTPVGSETADAAGSPSG